MGKGRVWGGLRLRVNGGKGRVRGRLRLRVRGGKVGGRERRIGKIIIVMARVRVGGKG